MYYCRCQRSRSNSVTDLPGFDDFRAGFARACRRRARLQAVLGVAVIPARTIFDAETEALLDKTVDELHRAALRKGKGRPPHPNSIMTVSMKQS